MSKARTKRPDSAVFLSVYKAVGLCLDECIYGQKELVCVATRLYTDGTIHRWACK